MFISDILYYHENILCLKTCGLIAIIFWLEYNGVLNMLDCNGVFDIYEQILSLKCIIFLAATKQLYEWYFLPICPSVRLSVCLSVRLSVCLSVCHTFLTMFPSSYHHEIFRSYHLGPG